MDKRKTGKMRKKEKMMIIFIGGSELVVMFVLVFGCIVWGTETVGKMLPNLFIVFLVKNIVQDIIFGLLKNRKNILWMLLYISVDLARIMMFFYTANCYFERYSSRTGFGVLFDVMFYLIIGGLLFLLGEMLSLLHGMDTTDIDASYGMIFFVDIAILLFLALFSALECWPVIKPVIDKIAGIFPG